MRLVLDANILIAALIKDGTTRRLLLMHHDKLELYTPALIVEEIFENLDYISKTARLPKEKVIELMIELLGTAGIELIEDEFIIAHKAEALEITPDKKDGPYFAAALYKRCRIWSNDKPLKGQSKIEVITIKELLKSL